jgi:hypothetical protein
MVEVPNTWRFKLAQDAVNEMKRQRQPDPSVPVAPPAPGGKPSRYDLGGQANGSNTVFQLPAAPDSKDLLHLYWNSGYVSPNDFELNGSQVTVSFVVKADDTLYAVF